MKINKAVILIGSTGFLGKNIKLIIENDNNFNKNKKILYPSKKELDLRNFKKTISFLLKIKNFKKIDIINCAAHVGNVHYGSKFQADIIYDNALMSLNLYKASSLIGSEIKIINPFANCSYPENTSIQKENEWLLGSPHRTVFSFASYKRFLYSLGRAFFEQYKIKSVNWMFGGGYGPEASLNENKEHALNGIIIRMIKAKNNNENVFIVWGTGKPVREWCYIKDMAKILKKSINIDNQIYPVNFGQKKGFSIKRTATIIKKQLSYRGKLIFDKSKQDGDKKKVLDNIIFKKKYPKFKFIDLKNGVHETINYYKKYLKKNNNEIY
jgi:GDP-L-fucose synthase